jgi:hypothetical protein
VTLAARRIYLSNSLFSAGPFHSANWSRLAGGAQEGLQGGSLPSVGSHRYLLITVRRN